MATKLTKNQIMILGLRYQGLTNKQIAEKLGVSEPNISQTLSRIAKKLVSIQDTLASLKDIGMIERDIEIEMTERGKLFFHKWKGARPSRVRKSIERTGLRADLIDWRPQWKGAYGESVAKSIREMAKKLYEISGEMHIETRSKVPSKKEKPLRTRKDIEDRYRHIYV